jgi:hypothetical protein
MDNLSKLGFLTAEMLIKKENPVGIFKNEDVSIIIANSSSSLDTDIEYSKTINDADNYFPSPSVFVYTLPNIMIGEICIKNKINGENTFFISEKFDIDFLYKYVSNIFETNKTQCCIFGRVELIGEKYESILYLVKKAKDCINTNESVIFEPENIKKLYIR